MPRKILYTDLRDVVENPATSSLVLNAQHVIRELDLAVHGDPRYLALNPMLELIANATDAVESLTKWLGSVPSKANAQDDDEQAEFWRNIRDIRDGAFVLLKELSLRSAVAIEDRYTETGKKLQEDKAKQAAAEQAAKNQASTPAQPQAVPAGGTQSVKSDEKNTGDETDTIMRNKILKAIVKPKCGGYRKFDTYAGGATYADIFEELVEFPKDFANFDTSDLQGIFMFGPPGTGKSRLAEAVAGSLAHLKSTFISTSASDLKGRYVGDSERGVKMLFEVARELVRDKFANVVVIFIDEIDGVISKNDESTGMLSEINKQMQGVGSENKGLIVLAATNYPARIPAAAMSRFQNAQLYIGLPTLLATYQHLHILFSHYSTTRYAGNMIEGTPERYKHAAALAALNVDDLMTNLSAQDKDALSFLKQITLVLYQNNYSARDVESIFRKVKATTMRLAHSFYALNQGDSWVYQSWLLDQTQMTVEKTVGNKCVMTSETRHALVPIKTFLDELLTDGTELVDEHMAKSKLTNNSDEIRYIATKKRVNPDTKQIEIMPVKVWDSKRKVWKDWKLPKFDMHRILGYAMITEPILMSAIHDTKPGTIEDIDELIQYITNTGQIFGETKESAIARLEDVRERAHHARTSYAHASQDDM